MTTNGRTATNAPQPSPDAGSSSGPLAGLRAVELNSEWGAFAGKLLADMGAEVISVEPPGGSPTRRFAPFAEDTPDPEHSLWFWHYNTSKRGVTLDLDGEQGRELLRRLLATVDFFLEGEPPGRLAALGLDWPDVRPLNPRLIMVSITPFGRAGPRAEEQATDLTILAGGGPVWSCGYDDHTLPPVRGGGNQGYQTGCHFAVMSALVALLARGRTGRGQHIDVNMHAAANVTTEAASYSWLVARETVQRQTGRHAAVSPSMPSQIRCSDGRWVNTGLPPRTPAQFRSIHEWMDDLGLLETFADKALLELAIEGEPIALWQIAQDELARAKFTAARAAVNFIAERIPAYTFFTEGQRRGFQFSIINAPEEALEDPHIAARGFPVEVAHPELGRSFRYPGAPYRFAATPWQIRRRAPLLGEDNAAVYGALGVERAEIAALAERGVI
jgi:crotonobetainyl-CoA:carnitine CoA-transferase CaiB-like acyl-CoA transferase